jgi:hypothetical protein
MQCPGLKARPILATADLAAGNDLTAGNGLTAGNDLMANGGPGAAETSGAGQDRIQTRRRSSETSRRVEATTLERINVALVDHALDAEIDDGNKIRVDCTV